MSTLGTIHVALALASLLTGGLIVLAPKATRWHRRAGWTYAAAMIAVNVSALLLYRLTGHFGPFHAAALFSLSTIVAGVIPARRRANRFWLLRHAYWMSGSYVGLWAAAIAETTTRTELVPFWWMVLISTLAVSAVGVALILTFVPRSIAGLKRRGVRLSR